MTSPSTPGTSLQPHPPNLAEALPSPPPPSPGSLSASEVSLSLPKQPHHTSGFADVQPTGCRDRGLHAERKSPDESVPGVLNMAPPIPALCAVLSRPGSSEKGASLLGYKGAGILGASAWLHVTPTIDLKLTLEEICTSKIPPHEGPCYTRWATAVGAVRCIKNGTLTV
ncbi:hypothetical protein HD554DRAFT_283443 [Boletus coccyginus]|nr:hypothetical protein HD554DRAFT_283443 [Boletus coccyginus]